MRPKGDAFRKPDLVAPRQEATLGDDHFTLAVLRQARSVVAARTLRIWRSARGRFDHGLGGGVVGVHVVEPVLEEELLLLRQEVVCGANQGTE